MIDLIEASAIPACIVGLLTALPGTQLSRRLAREDRLGDFGDWSAADQCTAGLNFVPLRSRRAILEDYRRVISAIYRPRAYFDRVRTLAQRLGRQVPVARQEAPVAGQEAQAGAARRTAVDRRRLAALLRLTSQPTVRRPSLARLFWRNVIDAMRHNPGALEQALMSMALYLHLGPFSGYVVRQLDRQIAALPAEG